MNRVLRVVLEATEEQLRRVLVQFAGIYSEQIGKPVTLRFAGGWVRDKLLGRPSNDIDVAVDVVTGEKFATALQQYLSMNPDKAGSEFHSVHTIASNPDKSKHLESATTRILGLDIDFVHLRSEKYTSSSRIPVVEFGTPEEDALRRDATLNALFYNLQSEAVEDFTGRGIQDLQQGILRTPLNAIDTFSDDPLRIMRLLRFSSQFDFRLAPDAEEAIKLPQLQQKLRQKVSAERIGVELLKLVQGRFAIRGLQYFVEAGLAPSVFQLIGPWTLSDKQKIPPLSSLGEQIARTNKVLPLINFGKLPVDDIWLASLLYEYKGLECSIKSKKPQDVVATIVGESIKLSRNHARMVSAMVAHADDTWMCEPDSSRGALGMLVRRLKEAWQPILAFTACKYDGPEKMSKLRQRILDENLEEAYNERALVNGGEIIRLFPEARRDAALKTHLVDSLYRKQFDGEITTVDAAYGFLKQEMSKIST